MPDQLEPVREDWVSISELFILFWYLIETWQTVYLIVKSKASVLPHAFVVAIFFRPERMPVGLFPEIVSPLVADVSEVWLTGKAGKVSITNFPGQISLEMKLK